MLIFDLTILYFVLNAVRAVSQMQAGDQITSAGCNIGCFQWSIFRIFEIIIFCFVVVILDFFSESKAVLRLGQPWMISLFKKVSQI